MNAIPSPARIARIIGSAALGVFLAATAQAQQPPISEAEQNSLAQALGEAGNSPIDFVRALESHIAKYPNSPKRAELERAIVKSAIDLKDAARVMRYGERVLEAQPDDLLLLEAVAGAEMQSGDQIKCELALRHAQHFLEVVQNNQPPATDSNLADRARRDDRHARAEARGYVLIARANGLLGHVDQAVEFAEKSYRVFASVEGAREAARWLEKSGKNEKALQYLANAFTIAGMQSASPEIKADRDKMGELFRKLNGSETGLGDVILKAYDRTFVELEAHRNEQRRSDPNAQLTDAIQFTLTGLSGTKFPLASLKGKVIVMDFWATWCGPCRVQHPLYEEAKTRFKDRGDVVFLAIDSDDDHSQVKSFLEKNQWSQTVYFDEGLVRFLKVDSIPTTLIFDKKGELFSRMVGFIPERFVDMLSDRIQEALGVKTAIQAISQ